MTEHQKVIVKCSNEDLLDRFESNTIYRLAELHEYSKISEDAVERYIDIKAEIIKRMNK